MTNAENPASGARFERIAERILRTEGIILEPRFQVLVGAGSEKRLYAFDLGSASPPILVECKFHSWTGGGNAPSAKLTVWNEAMYYFACAPDYFRKIVFVRRHERLGESLAEHYLRRFSHLIPDDVELWEFAEATDRAVVLRKALRAEPVRLERSCDV
jgi:hypothetical protein